MAAAGETRNVAINADNSRANDRAMTNLIFMPIRRSLRKGIPPEQVNHWIFQEAAR
jgi:hypothetical protein